MNWFLLALAFLLPAAEPPKKCTGLTPCPACTTCSRCRHCKVEGGTCGACRHPDNMVIRVIQVNGHAETVRLIGVDTPATRDPRKPLQHGMTPSTDHASLRKHHRRR